jgi:hypothetical protein
MKHDIGLGNGDFFHAELPIAVPTIPREPQLQHWHGVAPQFSVVGAVDPRGPSFS